MGGALLYGLVAALVLAGNTTGIIPRSGADIAAMMPALLTILALVVATRRVHAPAALAKPYERGD
jgi:simple sugar transport system permease protein